MPLRLGPPIVPPVGGEFRKYILWMDPIRQSMAGDPFFLPNKKHGLVKDNNDQVQLVQDQQNLSEGCLEHFQLVCFFLKKKYPLSGSIMMVISWQVLPIKDLKRLYLRSIANKHGQDEKRKYIDRCRLLSNSNDFNVIVSCVFLWTFPEEPYYNETLTSKTKNTPWQYIGIDVVNVLKDSLNMLNKHGLRYSWNPELQKKINKKVYLSDAYRTTSHQIATCL